MKPQSDARFTEVDSILNPFTSPCKTSHQNGLNICGLTETSGPMEDD